MYFSVDRIVSGKAMLIGEDGKPLEVPVSMLPKGAKEGIMLWYEKGKFTLDEGKTEERRAQVAEMLGILLNSEDENN